MLNLLKNQKFVKSFTLPHTNISQILLLDIFIDVIDIHIARGMDRTLQISDLNIYCGLTLNKLGVS